MCSHGACQLSQIHDAPIPLRTERTKSDFPVRLVNDDKVEVDDVCSGKTRGGAVSAGYQLAYPLYATVEPKHKEKISIYFLINHGRAFSSGMLLKALEAIHSLVNRACPDDQIYTWPMPMSIFSTTVAPFRPVAGMTFVWVTRPLTNQIRALCTLPQRKAEALDRLRHDDPSHQLSPQPKHDPHCRVGRPHFDHHLSLFISSDQLWHALLAWPLSCRDHAQREPLSRAPRPRPSRSPRRRLSRARPRPRAGP